MTHLPDAVGRRIKARLRPFIGREAQRALQPSIDDAERRAADHSVALADDALHRSPVLHARGIPVAPRSSTVVTPLPRGHAPADPTPVPPRGLWSVHTDYVEGGGLHLRAIEDTLAAHGESIDTMERILDFGCAAGRITSHLIPRAADREIWGVDIDAERIQWAQANLSPPCTSAPAAPSPTCPSMIATST